MGNSSSSRIEEINMSSGQFEIILDRLPAHLLFAKFLISLKEDQEFLIEYAQNGKFRIYSTNIGRKTMKEIKVICKNYVTLLQDRFWCQYFERIPIEQWDWLFAFKKWLQRIKQKDLQKEPEQLLNIFANLCMRGNKRKKLLGSILKERSYFHYFHYIDVTLPLSTILTQHIRNNENDSKCQKFFRFAKLPNEIQTMIIRKVYKDDHVGRGKFLWESTLSKRKSSALLPLRCLNRRLKSLVDAEFRSKPIKKFMGSLNFSLGYDYIKVEIGIHPTESKYIRTSMKVGVEMVEEYSQFVRHEIVVIRFDLSPEPTISPFDNKIEETKRIWREQIRTSSLIVKKFFHASNEAVIIRYDHPQHRRILKDIAEFLGPLNESISVYIDDKKISFRKLSPD